MTDHTIPGAVVKPTIDGKHQILKLKTRNATFNLRPVKGKPQTYTVQVTSKELPGLFKNSGTSSFGWFILTRYPGRNAVVRPRDVGPTAGNAVLMWDKLDQLEKNRCLEHLEKLLRQEVVKLDQEIQKQAA